MYLTRLAKKWWVAPVLLPVLCADLMWMVRNEGRECFVAELVKGGREGGCGSVPHAAIWADGDARMVGGGGYVSSKAARSDQPVGYVIVRWGAGTHGFLAPSEREEWVWIINTHETAFLGVSVGSAVADALGDAGYPLSPMLRGVVQAEGISSSSTVVWWGVVHDLVVVPAWLVAVGAVWFRIGALGRWMQERAMPMGVCVSCRYDLRGLPVGVPCPECGQRLSKAA
ncbi:MAG: hypothetical protein QM783_03500 [Phycisphaerales bacterium]